jgi:hypothetical protein
MCKDLLFLRAIRRRGRVDIATCVVKIKVGERINALNGANGFGREQNIFVGYDTQQ